MRSILNVLLAVPTGIAVVWITAGDVFTRCIPGLPRNELEISRGEGFTRVHLTHEGTWTGIGLWVAVLVLGWGLKRWGRGQIGLGALVAIPAALPLGGVVGLTDDFARRLISFGDWRAVGMGLIGLLLIAAVVLAKVTVWTLWWGLVSGRRSGIQNRKSKIEN